MDITFSCTKCGQHIVIDEVGAGLLVQCPKCNQSLTVPRVATASQPSMAILANQIEQASRFPWRWIALGAVGVVTVLVVSIAFKHWQPRQTWVQEYTTTLKSPISKPTAFAGQARSQVLAIHTGEVVEVRRRRTEGLPHTPYVLFDRPWDDGAEDVRSCEVVGIPIAGLVVEMTYTFLGAFPPEIAKEYRMVFVAGYPKEKSIAQSDTFRGTFRRDGTVDLKDRNGVMHRLPRWVYVSGR